MAPFSSTHTSTVPHPLEHTFDELSSEAAFKNLLSLSPATHSVDLLAVEHITLSSAWLDRVLRDSQDDPKRVQLDIPSPGPEAADEGAVQATSYRFKLVERVVMLGGAYKQMVEIFGTQTVVPARRVHLYDSVANGGLVKVLKVRRFEADGPNSTKIAEQIRGDTMWLLRRYTEGECRRAHAEHMSKYHELVK